MFILPGGAWEAYGLPHAAFDKFTISREHDVLTESGLAILLRMMVRVAQGGLILMGLPCTTWVFISRRYYRRSWDVEGCSYNAETLKHNAIAHITAYLYKTAIQLGCRAVIENPLTSIVWRFRPIAEALNRTVHYRCQLCMSSFLNQSSSKPVVFIGTPPWLPRLEQISKARRKFAKPKMPQHGKCQIKYSGDRKHVKGRARDLEASEVYTLQLGCVMAMLSTQSSVDDCLTYLRQERHFY